MPPHRLDEWNKALTNLENVASKSFEKVKDSSSTSIAMPSSSGVSRDACVSNASTTRTTIIRNESFDNEFDKNDTMDDLELAVQNEDFLYEDFSNSSCPDLNMNASENEELCVTKFCALNEPKSITKFNRFDKSL